MKPKILLQIDHDENPSVFDAIVGIDAGIDHLLRYGGVTPIEIESIVHGAIFTRGPKDLHNTALFFGGSKVQRTEELFEQAKRCFFGSMRVSMMCDPNGNNTTAVAAVLCAANHHELSGTSATVLAGTGPVGQRICQLLVEQGVSVQVCSRTFARAETTCSEIVESHPNAKLKPVEVAVPADAGDVIRDSHFVFAAGAAGVELMNAQWQSEAAENQVMVDVNAVPPVGISGVEVTDKAEQRFGRICYGAIGVGELKMKIHKRALRRLFESNDAVLGLAEIFEIGKALLRKA